MAINQDAYLRYTVLDRCLRNRGRLFDRDELLKEIENELFERKGIDRGEKNVRTKIGRTQFFYDLRALEDAPFFAEIERYKDKFDHRKVYYRYADPHFSIRNSPISDEEKEYLKSSISLLERISGLPTFELLQELLPILKTKLGVNHTEKPVIGFENNPDYIGLSHISDLFNAIVHKRVVEIHYQPYQEEKKIIVFHPYYLKEFNSRWFVIGYSDQVSLPVLHLALDRIVEPIFEKNTVAYIQREVNWEEYFEDIVGVSLPDRPLEHIRFLCRKERAPYIITKPIHSSQKKRALENGMYEFRLKIKINRELIAQLFSFGSDIEILEPEWLKLEFSKQVLEMHQYYSSSNSAKG
jgi:predicted DNA-binding transcriptional regulator YafY